MKKLFSSSKFKSFCNISVSIVLIKKFQPLRRALEFQSLLILIILKCNFSVAQIQCGYDFVNAPIEPSSQSIGAPLIGVNTNNCNNLLNYIPNYQIPFEQFDELTIRVSVIIIQDIQNGVPVSSQHDDYALDMQNQTNVLNDLNYLYSHLEAPVVTNPNPTLEQTDTKIRFVLDNVYYFADPLYAQISQYADLPSIYNLYGQKKSSTMNIIYTHCTANNTNDWTTGWGIGYQSSGARGPFLSMVGHGPMVHATGTNQWTELLGHEVGHVLLLPHSWSDSFDDTPPEVALCAGDPPCTNNIMNYNSNRRRYFSPKQIATMRRCLENRFDIIPGDFDGQIGYDNQNRNTGVLSECNKIKQPYYVNGDETWVKAMVLGRDIIVAAGNKLTIKCKVSMANSASIIVEPGGKLYLDGALLTNSCNSFWRGIRLKGNGEKNQYPISGSGGQYYQGYINAKNSIIENAEEAIEAINDDGWRSGGIIIAENCTFRNNVRSVSFQSYHNFTINDPDGNSGNPYLNEINNISAFTKCDFIVDRDLNIGSNPIGHVTMWDVKGIYFRGCKWENRNPAVTDIDALGIAGIFSIDSEYFVTSNCNVIYPIGGSCPPESIDRSQFINLQAGIRSLKTSGTYRFTVTQTDFTDCMYGIYNDGHDRIVAFDNTFTQGNNIVAPFLDIGIVSRGAMKYIIEQNSFIAPGEALSSISLGTAIQNSGMVSNEVYKNNFDNLFVANLSLDVNRKNDPDQNQLFSGLEYRCNDMTNDDFDIAVLGSDKNAGINLFQGSYSPYGVGKDAGNLFSNNNNNPSSDYYNETWWPIMYIPGFQARSTPLSRSSSVLLQPTSQQNLCPAQMGGKIVKQTKLTSVEKLQLTANASVIYADLAEIKTNYIAIIDGGNTDARINEVNNATLGQADQLRINLLNKSPYLTEKVLKTATDKDEVLSNAELFEILSANPDGIRGEELKKILQEKNNPFPSEWIEYLEDQKGIVTYRTTLEFMLSYHQRTLEGICDQMIADAMMGEEGQFDYSSMKYWTAVNQSLHSDFLLFDEMIDEGTYNEAAILLDEIPSRYRLNGDEMAEFTDFKNLAEVVIRIRTNNLSAKAITPDEIGELSTIAGNGDKIPNIRAKNWLALVNSNQIDWFIPQLPNQNQAKLGATAKKNQSLNSFTISPNPASDFIYITWVNKSLKGSLCEIFDASGKQVIRFNLSAMPLQRIELPGLSAGFYSIRITEANGASHVEKLILK